MKQLSECEKGYRRWISPGNKSPAKGLGAADAQLQGRDRDAASRQIKTLEQLCQAADNHRAVTCNSYCFRGPIPAAFMVNLSGAILHRLITAGMWVYVAKGKRKHQQKGQQ